MTTVTSIEASAALAPLKPERVAPASFAQRRLWFLQQLEPAGTAYNLPIAWRLVGTLNREAFEGTVAEMVRRHSALRTTFCETNGEPIQMVWPWQPGMVAVATFDNCTQAKAREIMEVEVRAPFDLQRGPLFRTRFLCLGEAEHIALFNAHHIIWDGWSIEIFRREFAIIYEALSRGLVPVLPGITIEYADFAVQEQTAAESADWRDSLDYWRKQLCPPLPVLELPTDRLPSASRSNAAIVQCSYEDALTKSLKALSRKHGVTLFMTLLAAFKALLHRYTGEEDIVVGAPVAGRDLVETERLIGFFVNPLVLRTSLSGDPAFSELLARIRATTLEAYAHKEVPFERIVRELAPERNGSRQTELFKVAFGFERGNTHQWEMGGLRASLAEVPSPGAKFDWTFLLEETDCGLKGSLEYNTDLFGAETIERFLQHFRICLEGVVAGPNRRISEIPLLTDGEIQRLEEWNRTATTYEHDATVPELFSAQVRKNPDAIALVSGEDHISYGELDRRADELARELKGLQVGPGVVVGLSAGRSTKVIVAMLAVLKAGGAYLPLDPTNPRERIEFMLKDAGAKVLIADDGNEAFDIRCLTPDIQAPAAVKVQGSASDVPCSSADIAYVMFTSGSTGAPKGVAIPHRAILRLVRNTNYATFSTDDVFLQLAPVSFDASTFEIWGALLNGAKLVVFPPHTPSLEELARTIQQYGITTLWLTAGLFNQMEVDHFRNWKSVRQLLAGGDVLSVSQVLRVLGELPDCQVINGYGPTENTTFTACYRIPSDWQGGRSVPIGKPISNTQVLVLDRNLSLVPVGLPGELYAGGDGLARGYVNRPELSAEKFISNPFNPNERLYRTGDLVRWLPDGTLEFLGRKDQQVKIRGYRVELGEIEATLAQHPSVRECAVVAVGGESATKQVVAFVGARTSERFDERVLRAFLEGKLPAWMVPSRFVQLSEIPLTPNGKVDRRAFASFEPLPVPSDRTRPRTEAEQVLTQIWAEVLGTGIFGIHDNFFRLGGHSLLATQVISRIAKRFHVELPISSIFEAPTIAQLAQRIGAGARNAAAEPGISPRIHAGRASELLERLDELSDTEIEALLHSRELNQVSS